MSLATVASAWRTAASNGNGSIVKSTSPRRTSSPSLKWTFTTWPATRDLMLTDVYACTFPTAMTWTGTIFWTTGPARVTAGAIGARGQRQQQGEEKGPLHDSPLDTRAAASTRVSRPLITRRESATLIPASTSSIADRRMACSSSTSARPPRVRSRT